MKLNTKEEFKKVEEILNNDYSPLCFHANFKLKDKNYKEFIENFFLTYKNRCTTYRLVNGRREHFCSTYRTRSLQDLYLVTKHYFPRVTLEKCKNYLLELEKQRRIQGSFCSTVERQVYHVYPKKTADVRLKYIKVNRQYRKKDEMGLWI